jgi:ABC-2 type transport system ATP-binding protein
LDSKVLNVKFAAAIEVIPAVLAAFSPSQPAPDTLRFQFKSQQGTMQAILGALQQANLPVSDLSTEEGDLEDLFLELTGEK